MICLGYSNLFSIQKFRAFLMQIKSFFLFTYMITHVNTLQISCVRLQSRHTWIHVRLSTTAVVIPPYSSAWLTPGPHRCWLIPVLKAQIVRHNDVIHFMHALLLIAPAFRVITREKWDCGNRVCATSEAEMKIKMLHACREKKARRAEYVILIIKTLLYPNIFILWCST